MTDSQNNHLDMYRAVAKLADNNAAIVNTVIAFKNGIAALKVKIGAIETTSGQQAQNITGVAQDKKALRKTLCETTFSVISPVKAYAVATNNNTLKKKMDLSLSDLLAINDDEIAQFCKELYNLVEPLVVNLGDYGITSAVMSAWIQAINDYKQTPADPRLAIVQRETLTKNLKQLFKEANTVCTDTLDPLSIKFKAGNKDFYNQYIAAREVIDLGATTTLLRGFIKDKEDGTPVEAAEVSVSDGSGKIVKSNAGGKYSNPKVKPGTWDILVQRIGYKDATKTAVLFVKGKRIMRSFKLEKS